MTVEERLGRLAIAASGSSGAGLALEPVKWLSGSQNEPNPSDSARSACSASEWAGAVAS